MKFPDEVREILTRRYRSRHREWLKTAVANHDFEMTWPIEINLDVPTEQDAIKSPDSVRAWISTWRSWPGQGKLIWGERRWRALGTQCVPERLRLAKPDDVATWIGEEERWSRAVDRFRALIQSWPFLIDTVAKHFNVIADYDESDFIRLSEMLSWICANPKSDLYPRQIPLAGIDSKWLEARKGLVAELVATLQGDPAANRDFFSRCGLKPQPQLIRIRLLDPELRNFCGGLSDISAPWEQIAALRIRPTHVFIVENLQTGLAFEDLPRALVIMRLGYGVDVLGRIPWLNLARCCYWGDIDTHGFAILNRARAYVPGLRSVLMDEATLLSHRRLWVEEKDQHAALKLPLLTEPEQMIFQSLKANAWGQQVRLEQERIRWDVAWQAIQAVVSNYRSQIACQ